MRVILDSFISSMLSLQGASTVEDDRKQRAKVNDRNLTSAFKVLDGKDLNDIPAVYAVPTLQPFEFAAVGVWIDKRIVPGFKYRVRSIDSEVCLLYLLWGLISIFSFPILRYLG